jgi:hypothetical protein
MCRVSVCVHCVQGVMFDLLQGTMFMLNCSQICSQRECAGDIDEHACTQSSNQHEPRISCVSDTPPLGLPYYPRGTVRPTVDVGATLLKVVPLFAEHCCRLQGCSCHGHRVRTQWHDVVLPQVASSILIPLPTQKYCRCCDCSRLGIHPACY